MTPKAGLCLYLNHDVYASGVCVCELSVHVCINVCACICVLGRALLASPSVP